MWLSKSKADSARMNMPRYRKNASADSAGSIRYPATLSDLTLWTSVTLLSEISIREHRRVAFSYPKDLQYKKNKNL